MSLLPGSNFMIFTAASSPVLMFRAWKWHHNSQCDYEYQFLNIAFFIETWVQIVKTKLVWLIDLQNNNGKLLW